MGGVFAPPVLVFATCHRGLREENMREGLKKLTFAILCGLTLLIGAFYFYHIHTAFVPNGEDLYQVWLMYNEKLLGSKWHSGNIIFQIVLDICYAIGGLSYKTIQLEFTVFCTIIMLLTMLLIFVESRKSEEEKSSYINYGILPLFSMFMILLQPIKEGSNFGMIWGDDVDMIYMFPFDYHAMSQIFALISLCLLVFIYRFWDNKKLRTSGLIISALIFIYSVGHTDLIYYVVFVAPFAIVLLLHGLRQDKLQKIILIVLGVFFMGLFATKFLSGEITDSIWSVERTHVYGGVYGAANFAELLEIGISNVINYIFTIGDIFNINIWARPVISVWSVLFFIKIAFVVAGYILIFKIIKYSLTGSINEKGYDMTDEIIAWGFLILSLVYIMTDIGSNISNTRYMPILVPYMTIIICRHGFKGFSNSMNISDYRSQLMVFLILTAICINYAEPVWKYTATDNILDNCQVAVDVIEQTQEEMSADSKAIAIAPHWLFARLTCMSEGQIIFYPDLETARRYAGDDAKIKYIVTSTDMSDTIHRLNNCANAGSYEGLCDIYGEPVRAIPLEFFEVYVLN